MDAVGLEWLLRARHAFSAISLSSFSTPTLIWKADRVPGKWRDTSKPREQRDATEEKHSEYFDSCLRFMSHPKWGYIAVPPKVVESAHTNILSGQRTLLPQHDAALTGPCLQLSEFK